MRRGIPVLLLLLTCLWGAAVPDQSAPPTDKAKVVDAFGTAQKRVGDDKASFQNINVGDLLPTQTTIKTGDNSAVLLLLPDRHVFRIGAQTTIQLRQLGKDKEFSFSVLAGHVWSFVRRAAKPARYEIETPSAVVGVSGTVFSVSHDPDSNETQVSTANGAVQVRQGQNTVTVPTGYFTSLRRGLAAQARVQRFTPVQRRMWQAIRRQETWVRPGAALRLNRRVEQSYRPFLRRAARPRSPGRRQPHPQVQVRERRRKTGEKVRVLRKGEFNRDRSR